MERMPVTKGKIHDVQSWPLVLHEDDRGQLVELWRKDDPKLKAAGFDPVMAYISWTYPGFVRGFHVHPGLKGQYAFSSKGPAERCFSQVSGQRDCFLFMDGTYRLALYDARENSPTFGTLQQIYAGHHNRAAVIVPSGVWHAYKNVGNTRAMVVNFPDALYRGEGCKAEVDELRETSAEPFFDFNWEIIHN
jgi:dTDP-4-dehydrorhamnose 3,5-epimerase